MAEMIKSISLSFPPSFLPVNSNQDDGKAEGEGGEGEEGEGEGGEGEEGEGGEGEEGEGGEGEEGEGEGGEGEEGEEGEGGEGEEWEYEEGEYVVGVSSVGGEEEGKELIGKMISERMIACGNVMTSPMESFFWWSNEVVVDKEYLLLFKTHSSKVDQIIEYVVNHHPYDLPEIIFFPIQSAYPLFLRWISSSLSH